MRQNRTNGVKSFGVRNRFVDLLRNFRIRIH